MFLPASFQKLSQKVSTKGQQQAATAYLGSLALSDIALADLMIQAADLTAQVLSMDYSLIWQLDAGQVSLLQNAGSGWRQGSLDGTQVPAEESSLEGFTLTSQYPIIIEDFREESRFKPSSLLQQHGVVSAVSVLIGTVDNPRGVLQVFSRHVQSFAQVDIYFLQSIANILALFMHLKNREAGRLTFTDGLPKQPTGSQLTGHSMDGQYALYEIKNRLIESTERERLRLAQELHDVPIQDLYGLIYRLEDLKDSMNGGGNDEILHEYDQTLRQVVDNLRAICGELRPPSLSPFGLEVAIRDHVEKLRAQNPDLEVHLELTRDQQVLSDSLRLCLFRIYQQSIHNVVRHAEATDVYVRFRWNADTIILEIEDNGKGFEVPRHWVELVRRDHFGLAGLAERMETVHGKLEVVSALGNGTLVRALVPRH